MTVLSINKAKQIQFVGKNFMRNFKPVMEVFDFCESKKVCLLSSGIDSRPDASSDMSNLICVMRCPGGGNYQKANGIKLNLS